MAGRAGICALAPATPGAQRLPSHIPASRPNEAPAQEAAQKTKRCGLSPRLKSTASAFSPESESDSVSPNKPPINQFPGPRQLKRSGDLGEYFRPARPDRGQAWGRGQCQPAPPHPGEAEEEWAKGIRGCLLRCAYPEGREVVGVLWLFGDPGAQLWGLCDAGSCLGKADRSKPAQPHCARAWGPSPGRPRPLWGPRSLSGCDRECSAASLCGV